MKRVPVLALALVLLGAGALLAQPHTDHPDNAINGVNATPPPQGGLGAVINNFALPDPPVGAGDLPVGLEGDAAGDLWTTEIVGDDIFRQSTSGALVDPGFNSAANTGNPIGVTIDNTGNLWLTDTVDQDVDLYSTTGTYQSSFSVAANTTFPEGITYNPFSGNLYVVDGAGGNAVIEYDLAGTVLNSYPVNGSSQDGIAFDPIRCSYWLYDSGTDTVSHYDLDFTLIESFPGTAANAFGTGEGLGVVGDSLFVVATGALQVVEFDIAAATPSGSDICAPVNVLEIPTANTTGLVVLALMLVLGAGFMIRRRVTAV